jgi:hypothetical protein
MRPTLEAAEAKHAPDADLARRRELLAADDDFLQHILKFYFAFVFSKPYVGLLPEHGVDTELYFPGGPSDPRNAALIKFRIDIGRFIKAYARGDSGQLPQWPRNIET